MQWLCIFAWTYTIFVVHSGFARALAIYGCTPHLVLAGLILMAVRVCARQGLLFAAGWGLLLDCLGTGRIGINVVALTLAAAAVQQIHARWPLQTPWRLGTAAFFVIGFESIASAGLPLLAGGQSPNLRLLVVHAAGSAVYSGLVVAMVSLVTRMILRPPAASSDADAPRVSNKWRMLTE